MMASLINEVKAWLNNSAGFQLLRVSSSENQDDKYFTNDIDEVSNSLLYVGSATASAAWRIQKLVGTKSLTVTYATIENNSLITTYSAAWAARLTLTYDPI